MEEYLEVKKLGVGGQGTTHSVIRKADKQTFVIKQIACTSIGEANYALKEAKTLQKLVHPGVVKYEDVFLHERTEDGKQKLVVCIVMELCQRGDLATLMNDLRRNRTHMQENKAVDWLCQMSSALEYVHGLKMVHRDLKPLNIFVTITDGIKIGDFGLARQRAADRMSKVGTPCYLAPEVMNEEKYGEAADVWGLGCIGLEMLSLNFLWEIKGLLSIKVLTAPVTASEMSPTFSAPMRTFVAMMLDKDPTRRPTTVQCATFFRKRLSPKDPLLNTNKQEKNKEHGVGQKINQPPQLQQQHQMQHQQMQLQAELERMRKELEMAKQQQNKETAQGGKLPKQPSPEPPLRAHDRNQNYNHIQPDAQVKQQNKQQQPAAEAGVQAAAQREGYWRHKLADPVRAGMDAARKAADMAGTLKEQIKAVAKGPQEAPGVREAGGDVRRDADVARSGEGEEYTRKEVTDDELWEGISFFLGAGLQGESVVETCMQDESFHKRYIGHADNRYAVMQRVRRLMSQRCAKDASGIKNNVDAELEGAKAKLRAQASPDLDGIPAEKLQERRRDVLGRLLGRHIAGVAEDLRYLATGERGSPSGVADDGSHALKREGSGLDGSGRRRASAEGAQNQHGVRRESSCLDEGGKPAVKREGIGLDGGGVRKGSGEGSAPPVVKIETKAPVQKVETKDDVRKLEEFALRQYNLAKECARHAEALQTRLISLPDGSSMRMQEGAPGSTLLGVKTRPKVEHYAGQFRNGRYNGYGSIELNDGKCRYVGQFVNDRYHGVGRLKLESGDEYFGGFAEGSYHGFGRYTSSGNGRITSGLFYKGNFQQAIDPDKLPST